ncbi:hypothetical protein ACTI_07570 [Actinoplanes sp. OR16]|nr:hypothetical protein ACTI_07570 [Actinoplanes sp. OR16]
MYPSDRMISPDPVPPACPFVAEIVTTLGSTASATPVAAQVSAVPGNGTAPGLPAAVCSFDETATPPTTAPSTAATAIPTHVTQPPPEGRAAPLPVSITTAFTDAEAPSKGPFPPPDIPRRE